MPLDLELLVVLNLELVSINSSL